MSSGSAIASPHRGTPVKGTPQLTSINYLLATHCAAGPIFFTWLAQLLLPLLLVNMVYEKERG